MRCIARCFELTSAALACALVASCVLDETTSTPPAPDADAGASLPPGDASVIDAPATETDAAFVAPPPVVCRDVARCAVAVRAPTRGADGPVADAFCALLSSGKVACWGSNARGELGRARPDASSADDTGLPGLVDGLSSVSELDRGCALRADGSVMCWGQVTVPGISDGTSPLAGLTKLPIPPAKKIAIAGKLGCALLSDDRVSCWGRDASSGQLAYATGESDDAGVPPRDVPIPPGRRIAGVFVGESVSNAGGATYALREDGTVLSWGSNTSLGRASSVIPDPVPAPVELAGIGLVRAGGASACAVAGGEVQCWGTSLGAPRKIGVYDPIDVATIGPRNLGRGCAATRSGDVYCWGDNEVGQAGDGTLAVAVAPVKVAGLPAPAVAVEVTWKTSCAVLVDGRVYCWGDGMRGQLGRVFLDNYSTTPLEVVLPESR